MFQVYNDFKRFSNRPEFKDLQSFKNMSLQESYAILSCFVTVSARNNIGKPPWADLHDTSIFTAFGGGGDNGDYYRDVNACASALWDWRRVSAK